jgi:hypothetical protein
VRHTPAAAAVASVLLAGALMGSDGHASYASAASGSDRVFLPTHETRFQLQASYTGRLVRVRGDCVGLATPVTDSQLKTVVITVSLSWPYGYSARTTKAGIEVLDAHGSRVAVTGQTVSLEGGFGARSAKDESRCLATNDRIYSVGAVESPTRQTTRQRP